jgi:hypothetical protein
MSLEAEGRSILDTTMYLVLGTVDGDGRPWVSPVWYAPHDYREFFWVSSPEVSHSRNLAARPEASIVVFDSQTPISTGQAVYMSAVVDLPTGADAERGIEIFTRRSLECGGREWTLGDVEDPSPLRLYRATASEQWMLDKSGRGPRYDHRMPVTLTPAA